MKIRNIFTNYNEGGNNYILRADSKNRWCGFNKNTIDKLKNKYNLAFNIVIWGTKSEADYYCIPFSVIDHLFTAEHMTTGKIAEQGNQRWTAIIENHIFKMHANSMFAVDIERFYGKTEAIRSTDNDSLMSIIHWINDDKKYENWITAHPDAFIANVYNPPHGKYFRIHRASHNLPDRSKPSSVNPRTGNKYSKLTALRISDLIDWAQKNLPELKEIGQTNYCKTCTPTDDTPVEVAPTTNLSEYILRADRIRSKGSIQRPTGNLAPPVSTGTTVLYYRDPKVRAWVLQRAADHCELCGAHSPFFTENEEPYLESHHLVLLSESGSDTPDNTAALCPNCHRNMHYGKERVRLRKKLSKIIVKKENEARRRLEIIN